MRLSAACSLWGLVTTMAVLPAAYGDLCFMLYQMADNDLEYFIRADLEEFSDSAMIKDSGTRTWIYFDHRNFDNTPAEEEIGCNLPFVYDNKGNALTSTKPDGSFYYKYDHSLQKLVVDSDLGELNSDIPQTVYDFATKALADCKAAGYTEYFIAFSSHGGGFDGFGGDENTRRLEGSQSNKNIASALGDALKDNGIDKFDIVGFDACLMSAYGVLDDFKSVAKYFLASEEVEPGHGWSYSGLTAQPALDTAQTIVNNFINDMQGDQHETPKTLAITDTSKYEAFASAWNRLCKEIKDLMAANDAEVSIAFSRARSTVYNFASVYDDDNSKDKAAVDLFGLISGFERLCNPGSGSNLATLLNNAKNAYADMFVDRQTGPNTPTSLTGMHIFFPSRAVYQAKEHDWDTILFNDPVTATTSSPEWLNLLKAYYSAGTPSAGGSSVCGSSAGTSTQASGTDLLTNVELTGSPLEGMDFKATVARSVDEVFIEYGINLTPLVLDRRRNRRLNRKFAGHNQSEEHPRYKARRAARREARRATRDRRLQAGDNFLYFYSGDIVGDFTGSEFVAFWDGEFYAIGDSAEGYIDIYVFDYGEGLKETPVIYFPASKPVTSDDVSFMDTFEDAKAAGGLFGYLSFSENNLVGGKITSGITLYADSAFGDTFSEVPLSRGGQIVPINYADGDIDGEVYEYLLGGWYGNTVEWNANSLIEINHIPGVDYKNIQDGESFTLDAIATDDDTGTDTVVLFEVDDDGEIIDTSTTTDVGSSGGGSGGGGGGGGNKGGTSGAQQVGAMFTVFFVALFLPLI